MDGIEKREKVREARRRLSAQRNRAGRLRGRVVAASLVCFALLWGVVFVQMATGNDPVLSEKAALAASRTKARHAAAAQTQRQAVEPELEVRSESDGDAEREVEAQPEAEAQAEPEVQAETESQAEPEVEAQPEAEVELEPVTTSQS
ncbi:MAG: hypothetical protein JST31_04195 [Actinobacteria bacterium]|nr:hypothetical protein [Actinomycetota bacterium]